MSDPAGYNGAVMEIEASPRIRVCSTCRYSAQSEDELHVHTLLCLGPQPWIPIEGELVRYIGSDRHYLQPGGLCRVIKYDSTERTDPNLILQSQNPQNPRYVWMYAHDFEPLIK